MIKEYYIERTSCEFIACTAILTNGDAYDFTIFYFWDYEPDDESVGYVGGYNFFVSAVESAFYVSEETGERTREVFCYDLLENVASEVLDQEAEKLEEHLSEY